jgi:ribosomal protein L7/L12
MFSILKYQRIKKIGAIKENKNNLGLSLKVIEKRNKPVNKTIAEATVEANPTVNPNKKLSFLSLSIIIQNGFYNLQ